MSDMDPVDDAGEDALPGVPDLAEEVPDPAEDLVAPQVVRETDRGDGPEADLVGTAPDRATSPDHQDEAVDDGASHRSGGSEPA